MRTNIIAIAIVAVLSTIYMIYQLALDSVQFNWGYSLGKAMGATVGLWIPGLLLAILVKGLSFLLKRQWNPIIVFSIVTSAWIIFAIFLLNPKHIQGADILSPEEQQLRTDALLIVGAVHWTPKVAAYCHQAVQNAGFPDILQKTREWSSRHIKDMNAVLSVIKAFGGISNARACPVSVESRRPLIVTPEVRPARGPRESGGSGNCGPCCPGPNCIGHTLVFRH